LLNGDAHYSSVKVRIELRIRPVALVFKDDCARRIPQVALTILIIEDHQAVSDALRDTLEAEGWRAVVCSNGAVALSRLASNGHYDLMITDNHLPHVDGLEVVRYARRLEHRAGLPVVMFSGSDCRKAAYSAGVNIFLRKPEDIGRLVETVRGLVHR
jgi:DNA-binding response OmpR family regulator